MHAKCICPISNLSLHKSIKAHRFINGLNSMTLFLFGEHLKSGRCFHLQTMYLMRISDIMQSLPSLAIALLPLVFHSMNRHTLIVKGHGILFQPIIIRCSMVNMVTVQNSNRQIVTVIFSSLYYILAKILQAC